MGLDRMLARPPHRPAPPLISMQSSNASRPLGQRGFRDDRGNPPDRRRVAGRSAEVRADERVLDVAAGNGNATLAAARPLRASYLDRLRTAFARKRRRARAAAEGLGRSISNGGRRSTAFC
jgi:hypothetical protein